MPMTKFQRTLCIIKIGALQNRTLGEATERAIRQRSEPKKPHPPIHLGAADLTPADLEKFGFKATRR